MTRLQKKFDCNYKLYIIKTNVAIMLLQKIIIIQILHQKFVIKINDHTKYVI